MGSKSKKKWFGNDVTARQAKKTLSLLLKNQEQITCC